MCLAQGPQCSNTGEARTGSPSVSSQALYHWATVLPSYKCMVCGLNALDCVCRGTLSEKISSLTSVWSEVQMHSFTCPGTLSEIISFLTEV